MDYIGNHVTYDQIRGAAGVSSAELRDEEMASYGLEQDLQLATAQWVPDSVDTDAVYTDGSDPAATQAQKLTLYALSSYLKHYGAYVLLMTGKLKFAKKISDSDNSIERYNWDNQQILNTLVSQANSARDQFLSLLNEEVTAAQTDIFMGKSEPDFDPVIG